MRFCASADALPGERDARHALCVRPPVQSEQLERAQQLGCVLGDLVGVRLRVDVFADNAAFAVEDGPESDLIVEPAPERDTVVD